MNTVCPKCGQCHGTAATCPTHVNHFTCRTLLNPSQEFLDTIKPCPCGSTELDVKVIYPSHKLIVECLDCGRRTAPHASLADVSSSWNNNLDTSKTHITLREVMLADSFTEEIEQKDKEIKALRTFIKALERSHEYRGNLVTRLIFGRTDVTMERYEELQKEIGEARVLLAAAGIKA